MFEFSQIGQRLTARSGIEALMDDLGEALAENAGNVQMLGGGNPAAIPAMEQVWRRRMQELMAGEGFERMLGIYDPPKGNARFCEAIAHYLRRTLQWPVGPEHIAVTNGGQTAFFALLNLLAGEFSDGRRKQVLLPVMPEYIGYANQGMTSSLFRGVMARIEETGPHRFKYRVDFDKLGVDDRTGVLCVSRPTNPSGNVLTDDEVARLHELATRLGIPLIVDSAYGAPFPGILFREIHPVWSENTIVTLSLSKLGLPGTRTGIVVAHPAIVRAISAVSAISGLANGGIGQAIFTPLLESGEIDQLVREVVQPFYAAKSAKAREWIAGSFDDALPYYVHENEGALFLWLWFPELPIDTTELYQRLKKRGVIVVPGQYFAYACPEAEAHAARCIRLSFAMADESVREGIRILGEELTRASTKP